MTGLEKSGTARLSVSTGPEQAVVTPRTARTMSKTARTPGRTAPQGRPECTFMVTFLGVGTAAP